MHTQFALVVLIHARVLNVWRVMDVHLTLMVLDCLTSVLSVALVVVLMVLGTLLATLTGVAVVWILMLMVVTLEWVTIEVHSMVTSLSVIAIVKHTLQLLHHLLVHKFKLKSMSVGSVVVAGHLHMDTVDRVV
jgi:hypothetical protein